MFTTALVNIWGKRIGAVAWDSNTNVSSFEFEPEFLKNEWDVSPLKMPIESASGKIFSFPELRGTNTFKGLPGLLADTLPDRYGNTLINAWLAQRGRPVDSMNPVEMLCFTGKRGMGALEFEPVTVGASENASDIEISGLIDIAQQILTGRQDFEADIAQDGEKALLDILKIGSSAGGARAKALIAFNQQTQQVKSGQADAPEGFSHWLLKFDGVTDSQLGTATGYGRVEMAYHLMATDCEIEMTECQLLDENGRSHFMTKRFDRPGGNEKLHIKSLCGMAHYDFQDVTSYSYEQVFQVMRTLRMPYPEAEQLYRRMVFNVMARNCDDRTKNFGFLMGQEGVWKLSPAYDICHAYRPGSAWVSQHALSVNGKRNGITREDLLSVAKQMNIKKAETIVNQVKEAVGNWYDYAEKVNVESSLKEAIGRTLLQL